ncbi:type III restriction/modification enzyme restriction subunit [Dyadobacter jejuensis]|uniref:Type III restriction/modification enzyme restriction subunit n=1 Tax=Dyadobacter jejuensis TaxID=1082580 RepID=A0A316ADT8_9BACT|nr:DEAD/DEAH box helicase family protein [Dyadobacter jejuensis]PWJ55913.1 type III restriction/modification enzyme restriction subunit [Dyadobacter jejuensis]
MIQHSAGSGKSNSITWVAYQLIETYPENDTVNGSKGLQKPLFDSVLVVTDRILLDKQIRENIKQFSEIKNIVAPAYSSRDLKEALESGKRIIITTIQKFPFIVAGLDDLGHKNFAVIIDEAHGSQSGTTAGKMNEAMGAMPLEEDEVDLQDKILKAIQSRKMKSNTSYLAFTATPKNATFERFGVKNPDGSFGEFHLYSMKQAIEEGFIKDVLANYTTYRSYYEIEKSIEDNPIFDTGKAQKKLRAFVERNESTIATKSEVMLDHFLTHVVQTKKLKGKAKGMVVTQNIESAIRYYTELKRILRSKGDPFRIAIAFSGKKTVNGIEHTEDSLNEFPPQMDISKSSDPGYIQDKIARYFNMDEFRLLVVANKYLTGFDQPKLSCMYIDKKLQGVLAVQALSRLNRAADKLDKRTEDIFVLDFFNTIDDIQASFDPFYTSTSLSRATDVNVLHDLKAELDNTAVYEWEEVEQFTNDYFAGVQGDLLSFGIDKAQDRFDYVLELTEEQKIDFKIKAKQFVKIYGQMASIIPFEVVAWEVLFWFLKFLIPKLSVTTTEDVLIDEILESVDLSTYGLERTRLNHNIALDDSEAELDPQNANVRGAHGPAEETNPLDEIIRSFNERWFHGWDATPEDQRVKFITLSQHIQAHPDFQSKVADNHDSQNRDLAFKRILEDVMTQQRKKDLGLYKLFATDEAFNRSFFDMMKRMSNLGSGW